MGVIAFVALLEGFSGTSVALIANYSQCPSPEIAVGTQPPAGYIPCDFGWKYQHAVLGANDWNLYTCLGSEEWAPSVIVYIDRTTGGYSPGNLCKDTGYFELVGIFGLAGEVGFYVFEVGLRYRGKQVLSLVKGGTPDSPAAYGNPVFDFLVLIKRVQYSPQIFGKLETTAQLSAAQKIADKSLYAELVNYTSNEESGRAVFVYPKHPNECLNFAEPYTVQIGFFPRKVSGTALVTGVYIGRETRAAINRDDLKKYGLEEEIPNWQRNRLLPFIGGDVKSEIIPWYMIDDCDSRRQEVQEAVYAGNTAKDRLINVQSLRDGKLSAFVTYHDAIPYLTRIEEVEARADLAEEKLAELEKHGINLDVITRGPPKQEFTWPKIPDWAVYTLLIGGAILALYLGYAYVAPSVERYLIQQDLNEISSLLQAAPASSKPGLLAAQASLQKAYTDLGSHGANAIGEAQAALGQAGQAIANALANHTSTISSTINSNSTSSSSSANVPG